MLSALRKGHVFERYRSADGLLRSSIQKIVPYKVEVKVGRIIVRLIEREGLNYSQTIRVLNERGIKKRDPNSVWRPFLISKIYRRWKGKL